MYVRLCIRVCSVLYCIRNVEQKVKVFLGQLRSTVQYDSRRNALVKGLLLQPQWRIIGPVWATRLITGSPYISFTDTLLPSFGFCIMAMVNGEWL